MRILHAVWCAAALTWISSCSMHSISGAYLNQGNGFVEMLQITAKADGSLEGTLTHAEVKANGALSQDNSPIAGVVDGHAITLVVKAPLPFLPSSNLSGTLDNGAITLTLPNGEARYVKSDAKAYQVALQQLKAQSVAIQQQRRAREVQAERQRQIDDENAAVGALNKRLTDYALMVQAPRSAQLFEEFQSTHERALAKARHGLEIQQKYPRGSVQATQVAVAILQVEVGMESYDNGWVNVPEQGHRHLQELDTAIAKSPCSHSAQLPNCALQPEALRTYQAVKPIVERRVADVGATLKMDHGAMEAIVKEADNYAR